MDQSSSESVEEILHKQHKLLGSLDEAAATAAKTLKRVAPYWHPYRTYAKQRWWNREILELVSTEFRDRSIEYYVSSDCSESCRSSCKLTASVQRYALESGVVTVNGKAALPGTIVRNGDRIE